MVRKGLIVLAACVIAGFVFSILIISIISGYISPRPTERVEYEDVWGGVAGEVWDPLAKSPVNNATVNVWEEGSFMGSVSTGSDGHFSFFHPMGTKDSKGNYYGVNPYYEYDVLVQKPGYLSERVHVIWRREFGNHPVFVHVSLLKIEQTE